MDYFSELLESYGKLKKRTFKLTYINEQEDALVNQEAENLVRQYIASAPKIDKEQDSLNLPTVAKLDGTQSEYTVYYHNIHKTTKVRPQVPGTGKNTGTTVLVTGDDSEGIPRQENTYKLLLKYYLTLRNLHLQKKQL